MVGKLVVNENGEHPATTLSIASGRTTGAPLNKAPPGHRVGYLTCPECRTKSSGRLWHRWRSCA